MIRQFELVERVKAYDAGADEEAINEELEFAANQDFKLEEGLEHEKENL